MNDQLCHLSNLLEENAIIGCELHLAGVPVNQRFPQINFYANHDLIYSGAVNDCTIIPFSIATDVSMLLQLDYFNKTSADTEINAQGEIVSNQHVNIIKLLLGDFVLTPYKILPHTICDYDLNQHQQKIYRDRQFTWQGVRTTSIYDNGSWKFRLAKPIFSSLMCHDLKFDHQNELTKLKNFFGADVVF